LRSPAARLPPAAGEPGAALRAWFLGPRSENAELLERLIVEALRDHVFWRRNHHPEDGFTIRETDKRQDGYEESVAVLTQELMGLLAELKRDVPFFSGRYKGHMVAEQTIAAQIGYFATMLYNPNNIAAEISPVTTRLELEVAGDLARMIGYDPARSWGHLTSGGTIANFERCGSPAVSVICPSPPPVQPRSWAWISRCKRPLVRLRRWLSCPYGIC
jgi:hypothetical protein